MEHRPDRFTVVLDTNVLAGGLIRNSLLHLAEAGFFRPRWSFPILEELRRFLERQGNTGAYIDRLVAVLQDAFPEACVENWTTYEADVAAIPDPGDRHVAAAAIKCDASAIVTGNLRDFPATVIGRFAIEAIGADDFLSDLIDLGQPEAVAALANMRRSFRNPAWTAERLVARYDEIGLRQTADILRPWMREL